MTEYAADYATGLPLCADCAVGQCREDGAWCEAEHCECMCRRATEADDRPDAALANIARDIEQEARPTVAELRREQHRQPLDPPIDGPRDWLRRRAVLADTLENIPQDYRRGRRP